jgi:hypothetical protein
MGTALAQQDTSVALDEPDNLPDCHQYSLATNHFKCLALNTKWSNTEQGTRRLADRRRGASFRAGHAGGVA